MTEVAPGTIVVFSDVGCPWATLAVHRLHESRRRRGLDDRVRFDHRCFPLELFNERPTSKPTLDAEVPVVGALAPDFGFALWTRPDHEWPVTTLLAMEAVQAVKVEDLRASEVLDLALRRAMFVESRCVSMLHVVLDVAKGCGVDEQDLLQRLRSGHGRAAVLDDFPIARTDEVRGSPHMFLPGGSDAHNPGITFHWEGQAGEGGHPVVDEDDPSIYDALLDAATRDA